MPRYEPNGDEKLPDDPPPRERARCVCRPAPYACASPYGCPQWHADHDEDGDDE